MLEKKIWRLPEVLNQTGLSRSTIYDLINKGAFPPQVKLGPRAVGSVAEDVLSWLEAKILETKCKDAIQSAHVIKTVNEKPNTDDSGGGDNSRLHEQMA